MIAVFLPHEGTTGLVLLSATTTGNRMGPAVSLISMSSGAYSWRCNQGQDPGQDR